tara:strand:+ start:793 stop:1473 length:681 start_codon:yes stop_codon:yes gene_type:complete
MGKMLTYSIKNIYPNSTIIAIRGRSQQKIESVDCCEFWDFKDGNIMYDDIACKTFIQKKYGPIVFIDTDMLMIKNIDNFVEIENFEFSLTERSEGSKLKMLNYENNKRQFPGLVNKTLGETMPYNGGLYFCKNNEVLQYMLSSFDKMEKEYFSWYGNQIALLEMVKSKKFKTKIFEDSKYNYTPSNINEDLTEKSILHFKGTKRYLFIPFFKKIFGESVFKKLFNL